MQWDAEKKSGVLCEIMKTYRSAHDKRERETEEDLFRH